MRSSAHVVEHRANPWGRPLAEWRRVVRPGGYVLLIVPHRDGTFDHRRPVTSLEHLLEDAERRTGEDDDTHLDEILRLHDLDRDPGASDRAAAGLEVLMLRPKLPLNIVRLCRVGDRDVEPAQPDLSRVMRRSPFASDRVAA
jgi:SAM-dependent methyltransferase